jgi:hypothetical protein
LLNRKKFGSSFALTCPVRYGSGISGPDWIRSTFARTGYRFYRF